MKQRVLRDLCEMALTMPAEKAAQFVIARGAMRHVLTGAARGRSRSDVRRAERKRMEKMLRAAGFDEAAAVVAAVKRAVDCEREGTWCRGTDGVVRCDSGLYEEDGDGVLRCAACRLRAA